MLKILLAFALGSALTVVVANQGQFVYSVYQEQYPHGTAIKVAPDPANIWSWHGTVMIPGNLPYKYPIVIDLDGDGKNDTTDPGRRVLVTDIQVSGTLSDQMWVSDGTTRRWRLGILIGQEQHFETPLMLPLGSVLTLETLGLGSPAPIDVNIIGRQVTL